MVEIAWSEIITWYTLSATRDDIIKDTKNRCWKDLRKDFLDSHTNQQNKLLEEIEKDMPFSQADPFIDYTTVKSITPITIGGWRSGEVFRIETSDGQKYKLRKCKNSPIQTSKERADEINSTTKNCESVLPKFYGQENDYLLFERIDGLRNFWEYKQSDKREKLWTLLAKINKTPTIVDKKKIYQRCESKIGRESIQKEFTQEQRQKIEDKLTKWFTNPNITFGLDLRDSTSENINIDPQGKFYVIDEEGIAPAIQWIGMGKLLRFYKDIDISAIKNGYEKIIKETNIFNEDFLSFAKIFMLLDLMRRRKKDHGEYIPVKKKILELI